MNLLSLFSPRLDNICQIQTKVLQCLFYQKNKLNMALKAEITNLKIALESARSQGKV
jgi:hypothetical protein